METVCIFFKSFGCFWDVLTFVCAVFYGSFNENSKREFLVNTPIRVVSHFRMKRISELRGSSMPSWIGWWCVRPASIDLSSFLLVLRISPTKISRNEKSPFLFLLRRIIKKWGAPSVKITPSLEAIRTPKPSFNQHSVPNNNNRRSLQ